MNRPCRRCGGSLRVDGGCGQCEQRAAKRAAREALGEWISHEDAARALGVGAKYLADRLRLFLTHQSGSLKAKGARNVGYVYARTDVAHVVAIKRALGCEAKRAAETLSALRRLAEADILDDLLADRFDLTQPFLKDAQWTR